MAWVFIESAGPDGMTDTDLITLSELLAAVAADAEDSPYGVVWDAIQPAVQVALTRHPPPA